MVLCEKMQEEPPLGKKKGGEGEGRGGGGEKAVIKLFCSYSYYEQEKLPTEVKAVWVLDRASTTSDTSDKKGLACMLLLSGQIRVTFNQD